MNYLDDEIEFKGKTLYVLLMVSFFGGLVAGALGLGGGSIYNPALLALGVDPRVSGATGMYLVLWSTLNAGVVNLVSENLPLWYGIWLGLWSIIGAAIGLILTEMGVRKTGRPSIFVWLLFAVFLLSVIIIPIDSMP